MSLQARGRTHLASPSHFFVGRAVLAPCSYPSGALNAKAFVLRLGCAPARMATTSPGEAGGEDAVAAPKRLKERLVSLLKFLDFAV